MVRLLAVVMLSSVAMARSAALPPAPKGNSTVIGGEIRDVDPVRDQFTLKVFGGRPMKVLFDERTEVYRNGVRIPVLDLKPEDHASIETTLDGTKVFALRIHMLSELPQGEYQGQVLSYNAGTGELRVSAALSRQPITLRVPPRTPIVRVGQDQFSAAQGAPSDLARGSLVDVKFTGGGAQGVATRVDILATPGSAFVFSGTLSFLDAHAGRLVILDPRDNQSYQVFFAPSQFPVSRELHEGSQVRVTANFDGSRYVASKVSIE